MNKESIRKDFSDKIYPSMVIRSQAETIELLEKESKKLQEEKDHYKHLYSEVKKQKDDVVEYIKEAMYSDSFTELPSGEITDISCCIPAFKDLLRMLGEIDG